MNTTFESSSGDEAKDVKGRQACRWIDRLASLVAPAAFLMLVVWAGQPRSLAADYALSGRFVSKDSGTSVTGPYALSGLLRTVPSGVFGGGAYRIIGVGPGLDGPSVPTVAPTLAWEFGRGRIVVSWPAAAADYVLEETAELGDGATWTPSTASVVVNAGEFRVTLEPTFVRRFYRLRQVP